MLGRRLLFVVLILLTNPLEAAEEQPKLTEKTKFGLELRFDFQSTHIDWEKKDASHKEQNSDSFVATSALLNLYGKIDEDTTYRIRYAFQSDFTSASASQDRLPDGIQYFYLTHKLNDIFSLQLGKQFVLTGSWEYNYSIAQIYHYSETFARSPAFYEVGGQLGATLGKQFFAFQLLNSTPKSAEKRSNKLIKVLAWYGDFLDGTIQPIASYALFPRSQLASELSRDNDVESKQWSVGTRINTARLEYEIIGGHLTTPDFSSTFQDNALGTITTTKTPSDEWFLVYGLIRYKLEEPNVQPFLKVTQDEGKQSGENVASFTRYSIGAEYFPTKGSSLRYHLVYVKHQDKLLAASKDGIAFQDKNEKKLSSLLVGMGANF